LAVQGQESYATLAADVANVLCTGYAWKLLTALPDPWETPVTAQQQDVCEPPESPRPAPVEFLRVPPTIRVPARP